MFITQVQNTRLLVNMQGLTYLFCEKILKNPSKTMQNHERVSEESCRHLRITPRYFARFLQIVDNGRKCPLLSLLKTTKADKELGFSFIQKIASCPCTIQYWSKCIFGMSLAVLSEKAMMVKNYFIMSLK